MQLPEFYATEGIQSNLYEVPSEPKMGIIPLRHDLAVLDARHVTLSHDIDDNDSDTPEELDLRAVCSLGAPQVQTLEIEGKDRRPLDELLPLLTLVGAHRSERGRASCGVLACSDRFAEETEPVSLDRRRQHCCEVTTCLAVVGIVPLRSLVRC